MTITEIITWGHGLEHSLEDCTYGIFQTALERQKFADEYRRLKQFNWSAKYHNCWQYYQTAEATYAIDLVHKTRKKIWSRVLKYQIGQSFQRQTLETDFIDDAIIPKNSLDIANLIPPISVKSVEKIHRYVMANSQIKISFEIIVDTGDQRDQKEILKSAFQEKSKVTGEIYQIKLEILSDISEADLIPFLPSKK